MPKSPNISYIHGYLTLREISLEEKDELISSCGQQEGSKPDSLAGEKNRSNTWAMFFEP